MAAVRFFLYSIILLIVIVAATLFCLRNESEVAVDFVIFQTGSLSVGVWILLSFVIGSLLGWAVSLPGWLSLKLAHLKRSRQLKNKQEELLRLKGDSAK